MNTLPVPQNYNEWRHCIIVECGLKLTSDYIAERLVALNDTNDFHTERFIELYGEQHLRRVIGWFEQAQGAL